MEHSLPPFRAARVLALLSVWLGLAACTQSSGAQRPKAPKTQTHLFEELGLSMELPIAWSRAESTAGLVFSGGKGTSQYFTTLALQSLPPSSYLDEALEHAYDPVRILPEFSWEHREPSTADGRPALRYALAFEMHETPWRKAGILVEGTWGLIDISYSAVEEHFFDGLGAFELVASTLGFF